MVSKKWKDFTGFIYSPPEYESEGPEDSLLDPLGHEEASHDSHVQHGGQGGLCQGGLGAAGAAIAAAMGPRHMTKCEGTWHDMRAA